MRRAIDRCLPERLGTSDAGPIQEACCEGVANDKPVPQDQDLACLGPERYERVIETGVE